MAVNLQKSTHVHDILAFFKIIKVGFVHWTFVVSDSHVNDISLHLLSRKERVL